MAAAMTDLLSEAYRKNNRQILLEVSNRTQWSELTAVGLEVSPVEITTRQRMFIKM